MYDDDNWEEKEDCNDHDGVDGASYLSAIALQLLQLICNSAKAANNISQLQPLHIQVNLVHHHHHHHHHHH